MKEIVSLTVNCLILACSLSVTANGQGAPNVLFIAIDDMNDWLGCLKGHPNAKTPNIDNLAKRGVLFANTHCQAPTCGPSRASVFSGLFPSTTGIYLQISDNQLRKSNPATAACVFLPDYFEQHGYRTFGVGKLFHKGDGARVFDEYGGWPSSYGPKPKKRINYSPEWFGKPGRTLTDWGVFPDHEKAMPDYMSAQWTIEKLKAKHDQPFFLAVGFVRPHVPWYLPTKWFEDHALEDLQTPPYLESDLDDVPEMGKQVAEVPMMPTTEGLKSRQQWKDVVQAYLACCSWTDHWVGEIVRALDDSEYANSTIIVLWSDHGYHLGEKNRFAKQALWERSTHVPLIFAGPGIEGGTTCSRAAGLIDIYPTLVELCGLPVNSQNEGRSLVPLLMDADRPWPFPAITSYGPVNFAIRDDRYRYIRYEGGAEELYDLESDPQEWNNLAGMQKYSHKLAQLRSLVPSTPAPLAKGSSSDINAYFRERLDTWGHWTR